MKPRWCQSVDVLHQLLCQKCGNRLSLLNDVASLVNLIWFTLFRFWVRNHPSLVAHGVAPLISRFPCAVFVGAQCLRQNPLPLVRTCLPFMTYSYKHDASFLLHMSARIYHDHTYFHLKYNSQTNMKLLQLISNISAVVLCNHILSKRRSSWTQAV